MAVIFSDGFDSYSTFSDIARKWVSAGTGSNMSINTTGGVTGGGCISLVHSSGTAAAITGLSLDRLGFGFWFKSATNTAFSQAVNDGFIIIQTTTGNIVYVWLSSGRISLGNNSGTSFVGTINVCDGNWHWIEVIMSRITSLYMKTAIDGVVDINTSQLSTFWSASCTTISLHAGNYTNADFSIDDLVVYSDSGNSPVHADFPLGSRIIKTTRPVSDGVCTFGTVSSGSAHYAMVDETVGDTSDYVEDNVSGHQDLYNFGNVGSPATITAVVLNSYMHNPGAGAINGKGICKSGATQLDGASTALAVGPKTYQQEFGVDPNTSAAWTYANLNSAQFGIKVA